MSKAKKIKVYYKSKAKKKEEEEEGQPKALKVLSKRKTCRKFVKEWREKQKISNEQPIVTMLKKKLGCMRTVTHSR